MQIKLTGFVTIEDFTGQPGDVVDVTDSNRSTCEFLLKHGSARKLESDQASGGHQSPDEDLDDDDDGLSTDSSVGSLEHFGVHPRYVKALVDAGVETVGEAASMTLAEISGISDAGAKQITDAIAQEMD